MILLPKSITQQFSDPELEAEYERIKREISIGLELQGRHDGSQSKVIEPQYYKVNVFNSIRNTLQELLNKCHHKHQPVSSIANVTGHRTESNERKERMEVLCKTAEKTFLFIAHEYELVRSTLVARFSPEVKFVVLFVLGLCESFLSFTLFRSASFPMERAIMLSFALGFCASLSMSMAAKYILTATSHSQKLKRQWIIIGVAFVITTGLGLWRANLSEEVATTLAELGLRSPSSHSGSTLPYVFLSFILFLCGLAFEMRYFLPDAEKKKHLKCEELKKEMDTAKANWDNLEAKKQELSQESLVTSSNSIARLEWAAGFEQRVCNLADQLKNQYERIYTENRSDGFCPKFFGESKDWGFTLYFADIFKNIKTQHP